MSGNETTMDVIEAGSPELEAALEQFQELVDEYQRFVVVAHISPDGDAVGSTLGLKAILESQGKEVIAYNRDPVPYNFQFLPESSEWKTSLDGVEDVDVTVLLDCGSRSRIGESFPEQGWGQEVVVIDHHETYDSEFADLYLRDPQASATGEVLFRLAMKYGDYSEAVAKNLYCCLMTDTGGFRYSNTTRTALRIAGDLVANGVEPWEMSSEIYENQPRERLELLSRVLDTLTVSHCGRLAFLQVTRKMVEEVDADEDLTDGFINYARSIAGVEVATQMRDKGDGTWRISFRSRGRVNVAQLAEVFGGGGHHNAAGCQIEGTPREVERELTKALVGLLDGE